MQTQGLTCGVLLMALAGVLSWGTLGMAGAPDTSPNVAQVDFQDGWLCPGPTSDFSAFFDVDGSRLALTTAGNPVLVSLTLNRDTDRSSKFPARAFRRCW
jgi:hypothetical protein